MLRVLILKYFFIIQFGVEIVVQVKSNPVAKDKQQNNNSLDKILQPMNQFLKLEWNMTTGNLTVPSEWEHEKYRNRSTERVVGKSLKESKIYTTKEGIGKVVKPAEIHFTPTGGLEKHHGTKDKNHPTKYGENNAGNNVKES